MSSNQLIHCAIPVGSRLCRKKWQENILYKIEQHTYPLSPGQTIPTCQPNMSQHCWGQHVACVWPPCCDVLQHVGCCWLKFETGQIWGNNTQHVATWWPNASNTLRPTMLRYVVLAVLLSFGRGLNTCYCVRNSSISDCSSRDRIYVSWSCTRHHGHSRNMVSLKPSFLSLNFVLQCGDVSVV